MSKGYLSGEMDFSEEFKECIMKTPTKGKKKTKTKELTPLEVSKQLKDFVLEFVKNGLDRRFIHGSFDIIETALKNQVNLELENKTLQMNIDLGVALAKGLQKKLEALEIIKKELMLEVKEDNGLYRLVTYQSDNHLIRKDQYDLLKEVLSI